MENIQIFENPEFGSVRTLENARKKDEDYFGYVYALEWGDEVKIGCTRHIATRIKQLRKTAEYGKVEVGRMAISPLHSNYTENEKVLHNIFQNVRVKGTELFKLSLLDVVSVMKALPFLNDSSNKIDEAAYEQLKRVLLGNNYNNSQSVYEFIESMIKREVDIPKYKYYIKFHDYYHIPLDNVAFTKCEICGEEIELPLGLIVDEYGYLSEDCSWCCDKCSKIKNRSR